LLAAAADDAEPDPQAERDSSNAADDNTVIIRLLICMILFPPAMMSADYQTMQDEENIKSERSIRLIFPHGRMTALKISIFHRLTKLAPKVFPRLSG
jgi:hypothetical protein